MAQIQEVRLIDDLEGGEADETVEFAFDGKFYEIDLSTPNATKLREALAPFVAGARRAGGRRGMHVVRDKMTDTRTAAERQADRERFGLIREWARGQGLQVADRGRINTDIIEAFDKQNTPDGMIILGNLLRDQREDGSTPAPVTNGIVVGPDVAEAAGAFVTTFKDATDKHIAKSNKGGGDPNGSARKAEDVTDEEVLAYREANGLEVKRRGKDGTGKVYPMAMASYRKQYMDAHGITA